MSPTRTLDDEQERKLTALLKRLEDGHPVMLDRESREELAEIRTTLTDDEDGVPA